MKNYSHTYPAWWTNTMEYVRTVSGTVYEDQLATYTKKQYEKTERATGELNIDGKNIVSYLNAFYSAFSENSSFSNNEYCFLKTHPLTGEVYTNPYMRAILDPVLNEANPDYKYNKYLYSDNFNEVDKDFFTIDCSLNLDILFQKPGPFFFDTQSHQLDIDFSLLRNQNPDRIVACKNFDLDKLLSYVKNVFGDFPDFHIGKLNAEHIVFLGDMIFSCPEEASNHIICCNGASFSGASFQGKMLVQNVTFRGQSSSSYDTTYDHEDVDFRNTRFFGDVQIRNVQFEETTKDVILTFEDSRISGNLEILNTNFEHAGLYCFQMIFGKFNDDSTLTSNDTYHKNKLHTISLINTTFESDSHIDFVDVELSNGLFVMENIPSLPSADLCFHSMAIKDNEKYTEICPDIVLLLNNCEIDETLKISNISQLSFNQTHNFSRIVEGADWKSIDPSIWKKTHKRKYREHTKGLGATNINNKLLLAVYNNLYTEPFDKENEENQLSLSKVYDFVMLKENFASSGMYDDEDTAFILYMEYKHFLDSVMRGSSKKSVKPHLLLNLIYKLLYTTGKYGISPLRVVVSLAAIALLFSLFFFIAAYGNASSAYCLGSIPVDTTTLMGQILGAFLYSLECVVPFVSQFEPISLPVLIISAIENFIGTFLIGYFSVAVIRKTLH